MKKLLYPRRFCSARLPKGPCCQLALGHKQEACAARLSVLVLILGAAFVPTLIKGQTLSQEAWVRHHASGLSSAEDVVAAVAFDQQNNIYITGYTSNWTFRTDYLIVKFNIDGGQVWTARYNGPFKENPEDWAQDIAVDAVGNVYVTGMSAGIGTGYDFATVKYNSHGQELWQARYNGPGNGYDRSRSIAVDGSGNVYVGGLSKGKIGTLDFTTIRYNNDGAEEWVSRLEASGNAGSEFIKLALDVAGNIYITGSIQQQGTNWDIVTVKYNNAGVEQWQATYNNPENSPDQAKGLAVHESGNVYVIGSCGGLITTMKYQPDGVLQWVNRSVAGSPQALAVDDFGNVHITGWTYGEEQTQDYITLKFDGLGKEVWRARYTTAETSTDIATSIAVDARGNVYVTGRSYLRETQFDFATVKYDAEGVEEWVTRYHRVGSFDDEAAAISVDAAGGVYVVGGTGTSQTDNDPAVVKYDSAGTELWVATFDGPESYFGNAVAIAGDGYSTAGAYDFALVKYGSDGVEQWTAVYDGPANGFDFIKDLAIDVAGNVYVTGASEGMNTGWDFATIKFDQAGKQQWVARYNGPANSSDQTLAIGVDMRGYVYVTGVSRSDAAGDDIVTIKYDPEGKEQWVARFNGSENSADEPVALAVDDSGHAYLTGKSRSPGGDDDYVTIQYDPNGALQWLARFDGPDHGDDIAAALALDARGNVLVTGKSHASATGYDYVTIQYDRAGIEQWVARYNGPGSADDQATSVAVDPASGEVYVTGGSIGANTSYDYATIKYDRNGVEQWVARYDGPANEFDFATALTLDAAGNLYVTGSSWGVGTSDDIVTIKYHASGAMEWLARYNGPRNASDFAAGVAVHPFGGVFVTGSSRSTVFSLMSTIRYDAMRVSVEEPQTDVATSYCLSQNFPNPLNPGTEIDYSVSNEQHVKLVVYDILGREVKTMVNERQPPGLYRVHFDASEMPGGIYFYRLVAGEFIATRKMIVLR